ncbi:hypothetical protein PsorP6_001302 [Peronosclerospora sorghi]|uniref:Uncharacterized protein n=1 Tax=Peronosclerospora sorghi TaxID=230839 RepID=A0ACC0WT86_9STRA|nr:hypothetical protein PsorP6_001302 [Peronosclerospora sorghi]
MSDPRPAARLSTLLPIAKGHIYASFDDAVNAARNHARDYQFSCKNTERKPTRVYLRFTGEGCPAYARIILSKKTELITLTYGWLGAEAEPHFMAPSRSQAEQSRAEPFSTLLARGVFREIPFNQCRSVSVSLLMLSPPKLEVLAGMVVQCDEINQFYNGTVGYLQKNSDMMYSAKSYFSECDIPVMQSLHHLLLKCNEICSSIMYYWHCYI